MNETQKFKNADFPALFGALKLLAVMSLCTVACAKTAGESQSLNASRGDAGGPAVDKNARNAKTQLPEKLSAFLKQFRDFECRASSVPRSSLPAVIQDPANSTKKIVLNTAAVVYTKGKGSQQITDVQDLDYVDKGEKKESKPSKPVYTFGPWGKATFSSPDSDFPLKMLQEKNSATLNVLQMSYFSTDVPTGTPLLEAKFTKLQSPLIEEKNYSADFYIIKSVSINLPNAKSNNLAENDEGYVCSVSSIEEEFNALLNKTESSGEELSK